MKMFRVEFKVGANKLGDVLASIHGSVDDLDVSLIEAVPHNKNVKRVPQDEDRPSTRDIIMKALKRSENNTITAAQAKKLIVAAGYKPDSFYTVKYDMVKKGLIEVSDDKITLVE